MRFFHLADLHIGKSVNGFSMLEDQRYIFNQILHQIDLQQPDAVLIAGDVYDKITPSSAAVILFDDFLTKIIQKNVLVFCISGNHDSIERISFGSQIFSHNKLFLNTQFYHEMRTVTIQDEYGDVHFHLLPFFRPSYVRHAFEDESIQTYQDAMQAVLTLSNINKNERNILITHQFITSINQDVERSDSEIDPIGGIPNIDVSLFQDFCYVALGHIHRPQKVGRDSVRYAGSPLSYSFSECNHTKSICMVDLDASGSCDISLLSLTPLHPMRKFKGALEECLKQVNSEDYMQIILTNDEEIINPMGKLRTVFPNTMELLFDNTMTRARETNPFQAPAFTVETSEELFSNFYKEQTGTSLSEKQQNILHELEKGQ